MHSKSGWSIVFAATILGLMVLLLVGSVSTPDRFVHVDTTNTVSPTTNLVGFAAWDDAIERDDNHDSDSKPNPLQLPGNSVRSAALDPVITPVHDPKDIINVDLLDTSNSLTSDEDQAIAGSVLPTSETQSTWELDLNADTNLGTFDSSPSRAQVIDELSQLMPTENQLESTEDEFEPILAPQQSEEVVDSLPSNPFEVAGDYITPDIADQAVSHQELEPRVLESTVPRFSPQLKIQDTNVASSQSYSSIPSPYIQASSVRNLPKERLQSEVVPVRRRTTQPVAEILVNDWSSSAVWPKPSAMVEELERLETIQETAYWAQETKQLIKLLHWAKTLDEPNVETIFRQLTWQLEKLDKIAISVSTVATNRPEYAQGALATQLRVFHYDIARHLVIWMDVHELAKLSQNRLVNLENEKVQQMILASRATLVLPGVGQKWNTYLALDQLESVFNSLNADLDSQRQAARLTLARLYSTALSKEQKEFLNHRFGTDLIDYLHVKATDSVELTELMKSLEKHESNSTGYTAHRLNDFYQSLLWSSDPNAQALAGKLDGHYRNANFRVSVSDELINRLLPETPEIQQPIQENVMGAHIQGNSHINNRLLIRLIPDDRKVNLRLESNGIVRSLTRARRSGFTIDNVGFSRFRVFKGLAINRNGVKTEAPYAVSDTNSQVVGMRSKLDPIPIVGWVARQIAQNKIQESAPATDRYTRQKLESSAKQLIETEVESHLDQVREYLFANMLQPLVALELEPTPLEMRTTDQRVIMRYLLAGRDQMAAHTARPRALADSLLSVQFHESVFNNLLDRIEISGQAFTAKELTAHLENVFRSRQAMGSDELDHEAYFEFAPYDPMRIEFQDSKIEISLNLRKFRVGKGKTWKNLNVRASFHPEVFGSKLVLRRDPSGIRLKGSNLKFRDQMAVRTVFTALFRDHYEMNVVPEKFAEKFNSPQLDITQLVINDGWIGVSLGDTKRTAVQSLPPIIQAR